MVILVHDAGPMDLGNFRQSMSQSQKVATLTLGIVIYIYIYKLYHFTSTGPFSRHTLYKIRNYSVVCRHFQIWLERISSSTS